jgi:hypothetical protein
VKRGPAPVLAHPFKKRFFNRRLPDRIQAELAHGRKIRDFDSPGICFVPGSIGLET